MPYLVDGFRQGVRLHTPRGFVENGRIERPDDVAFLTAEGYRLVPHTWREPVASTQERQEMEAADKLLGVLRGPDGRTRLERDIAATMREILKPLRKATRDPRR